MKHLIDMAALWLLTSFGAQVRMDGITIEELNDKLLDLNEKAEAIQAKADAEKRELTEEEQTEMDSVFAEFNEVEASIRRRERINAQTEKLAQRMGRQTEPTAKAEPGEQPKPAARGYLGNLKADHRGSWGWGNFGDFAKSVRAASRNGGHVDPRLVQNAPTTYSSEGVGADGGFLVPPDYRTSIMEAVQAETSLLGRTDQLTSNSNTLILPTDETTNWQSSGGIQAYWEGENDQLSQSKAAFKGKTVRLNKLTALVPVTEELMEDASALDTYLRRKVPAKFDFKINDAIVNGSGAGKPLGIMSSGSLVTVAKESGQAASTLVFENIINMWARMYGPSRQNAVWLVNQDIEPQLLTMDFPGDSRPVYLPPGGLSASPYGTLMGRPVLPIQSCQTLGTTGDIILADLTSYLTALKTQGIRSDVSMHLWFDYDTLAYRFIFRVAGMPWLDSAISPANGSNTLSPFVTLATRA